jgi:DNA-binding SARP family transcriptional activator
MGGAEAPVPMVRVLGAVRLSHGGLLFPIPPPKVRSLLALLVMRPGQVVSAERLVDELWEDDAPPSASTALRVHVSNLRALLARHLVDEAVCLDHRTPGYVLSAPEGFVDATVAERLLKAASDAPLGHALELCDRALDLWTGEPYSDVALRCIDAERGRLTELRLDVLEQRAHTRSLLAPPDAVFISELDTLVEQAPLRERFTELLMLALYRLRREAAALAAYKGLRNHLAEELGLMPSRALQDLEQAVLRQSAQLDWIPPTKRPAPLSNRRAGTVRSSPEMFVGRAEELLHLHQMWEQDRTGRGVLLLGEAGIGKSRLSTEFASICADGGATVVVGTCDPDQSVPYRPFLEILRQLRGTAGDPEALFDRLSFLQGSAPASANAADERLRFFSTVCELLDQVGTSSPHGFLVVIEDLHWIDEASAALLRFLVQLHAPLPLFTVATARSDEPDESVAWSRFRASLARPDSRTRVLVLHGLSPAEVAMMVSSRAPAPGPVATPAPDLLFELTGGNPLLVSELMTPLTASAKPFLVPGRTSALPVPATVAETVRHRLRLVSAPTRLALEFAAIAGERASATIVALAGGVHINDLYGQRAEAEDAHILVGDEERPDDMVFKHALVRQAVIATMPGSRRRHLHVRLASALQHQKPRSPDSEIAIARHLLDGVPACSLTEAAKAVATAANRAIRSFAFERCATLVEQTLTHVGAESLPPELVFRLLVTMGSARANLGRVAEAGQAFSQAADIGRRLDDPHLFAVAALGGDLPDRPMSGAPGRESLLVEALSMLDAHDCSARARVMSALARDGATPGLFVDRMALANDAVALARRIGEGPELFGALAAWHLQHVSKTSPEALAVTDELVRLSEVTGDVVWVARARLMRARELLCSGQISRAETDLAVHRSLSERTRRPRDQWQALVVEAALARMRGELDTAEVAAAKALAVAERVHLPDGLLVYGVHLFYTHFHRGTLADLRPVLERSASDEPQLLPLHLAAALGAIAAGAETGEGVHQIIEQVINEPTQDELAPTLLALSTITAIAENERSFYSPLAELLDRLAATFVVVGGVTATFGPADLYRAMLAREQGHEDTAHRLACDAVDLCDSMGATVWGLWSRAEVARALVRSDPSGAFLMATETMEAANELGLGGPGRAAGEVRAAVDAARRLFAATGSPADHRA